MLLDYLIDLLNVLISFLFDYNLIEKIEKSGWYDEFKEIMQNRIIRIFSQSIFKVKLSPVKSI